MYRMPLYTVRKRIAHKYKKSSGNIIIFLLVLCKKKLVSRFCNFYISFFLHRLYIFFYNRLIIDRKDFVSKRVEPPILVSRLMVFVCATAIVVLVGLLIALIKTFPLNRPQIFFLSTELSGDKTVKLVEMSTANNNENIELYKRAFIREYIRHRNEVFNNTETMQNIWNGKVRIMSTEDVYADFINTNMFQEIMKTVSDFDFSCHVSYEDKMMYFASENAYRINFRYFCADTNGDILKDSTKNYTVQIKLNEIGDTEINTAGRIDNPLGLRVSEYKIVEGDGDPLDSGFYRIN